MALPYQACPALHCLLRDPSPVSTAAGHALAHRRESLLLQPAVRHGQLCHRSRHLQLFLQLVATWAHAHNVHLQPTHVPGRLNDWADDLSRRRLHRFVNRPADRVRFSPCSLAQAGRGLTLCPIDAPWRPEQPHQRVCHQTQRAKRADSSMPSQTGATPL